MFIQLGATCPERKLKGILSSMMLAIILEIKITEQEEHTQWP